MALPVGTLNPLGLVMASRRTLESDADPSQPGNTNMNCISREQTANTFVAISPFLVRYLGFSVSATRTLMYVPSSAPKQFY